MATPPSRTPQAPLHHIKSAARKLPIKRKSPSLSSPAGPENPSPAADPFGHNRPSQSFSIIVDDGEGHGGSVYAADDYDPAGDESEDDGGDPAPGAMVEYDAGAAAGGAAVPFKFQRIWSEADEVRFLRELLACHSQGMVFPRDLNAFFDRFSKTMAQPYTRSQLYEKLRRLRKKFRIASARIARGLNPAAMSLHDRELFDLSTQLWSPSFADSSPFVSSGPEASKRRRRLPLPNDHPRHVSAVPVAVTKPPAAIPLHSSAPLPLPPPSSFPAPDGNAPADRKSCETLEKPLPATKDASFGRSLKVRVMNVVLDVFDRCLKEVQAASDRGSSLEPDHKSNSVFGEDLVKRWKEQRILELNAFASRMRLVIDNTAAQE